MHALTRFTFVTFFSLIGLLALSSATFAKTPDAYGQRFGLFLTDENRQLEVPIALGEQVLQSYFMGVPLKSVAGNEDAIMNQREFLTHFAQLKLNEEKIITTLDEQKLYHQMWLEARRKNWLPGSKLTYQLMHDFLYRYEVSKAHGDMAYFDGLVLSISEINEDHYNSMPEVKSIMDQLTIKIAQLRRMTKPTEAEKNLQIRLENYYIAFQAVDQELKRREHPTNKIPNLPEDIKQKILDNDLNQVLDQITYYYGGNIANRQYNLVKGLTQFNGKVYQPGDRISFTQTLKEGEGGLGGYKYGWTIHGNIEKWEYGGGLCGSATMLFTPSWRSGLGIISRKGHSSYFSNLYPAESLALDATVYFGYTDLIIENTTDSPLLYYVYDNKEAKEITMYVIGNSPYIDVQIEGPIKTGYNSYKYIRHLTLPDGTVVSEPLNTRYSKIY